jgi:hypothetical protein
MKKLFSLLLAITLLFSCFCLTSCEKELKDFNGMTPQQAYDFAFAAFAAQDNYTVNHKMEVKTKIFFFFSYTMSTEIEVKKDGRDWIQTTIEPFEDEEPIDMYYVNEVVYEKTESSKTCYDLPYEKEDLYMEGSHDGLINIPSEWLIDAKFYEAKNETYIEITVNGEEYYKYLMESGEDEPLDGEPDGDVIYRVYLNDSGEVTKIWMKMDCVITEDGVDIKATLTDTMIYSDFGTTVVSAPSDAASYEKEKLW